MKPTTRTQLTTATSLLLTLTANAELQLYDDRSDFNTAAPDPVFTEDFESFHSDVLLDRIPTPVLASSVVISGDSSHGWPWSIDSPNDGFPFVYPHTASGIGGITIPGEETFISGDANTYFTGILSFDFPPSQPPVHAFGLDFNGASGAANALAIPFYVGFRVTTADGVITTGRLADIHSTDVLGDGIPMPENGFFGVHSHDNPLLSVELYPMETDYDFAGHIRPNGEPLLGAGETYAVDNITVALPDTDADGIPDAFENDHGLDPASDDATADLDHDGRTNLDEFRNRTNPAIADTDGDDIDDNTESLAGSDPTNRNDPTLFDLYIDFNSLTANTPSMGAPYHDYNARDRIAAGTYTWTSMHYDVLRSHTDFIAEISTDNGTTYHNIGTYQMNHGTPANNPFSDEILWGPAPELLSSTVDTTFEANGTDDVIVRFTPLPNSGPDKRLFGINGFQLVQTATPEIPLEITNLHLDTILGSVTLNWASTPGKTYSVEATEDLASETWLPLATNIDGHTHTHEFPNSQLPQNLFVRVREQ